MTRPRHYRPNRRGLRPVRCPGQKEGAYTGEQSGCESLRERMVSKSGKSCHERDAEKENSPQSAIHLDLEPTPCFSLSLHRWLKLRRTLPLTL